jgi:CubicO group peptidase (beta-lactamase class C family)
MAFPQARSDALVNQAAQKSLTDKIDRLFVEWNKPNSPGCALGVIKDGQFIYKKGYGMANLDYNIPIDSKTVFYIASMSKQFTATSIALLAEQGKLSLNDDIRRYLPEMPQYQNPITISHLIHHTSGIRDYIVLKYLFGFPTESINSDAEMYETMARTTDKEVFELIARQKALNFAPGEQHMYSNSNYILLAEIVKRVSGKSLREFADENIFQPLGMINTHYYEDLTVVVKNRATGYSPRKDGSFAPVPTNNGTVGPAGVLTTVEDLLLWDRNFYGNKLGKGGQDLINLVLTSGAINNGEKLRYAFGLVHYKYNGLNAVGHDGGFFGFKTSMNRFPEQRFTVICLCNSRNAPMDALADQVADIYLADQFKQSNTSSWHVDFFRFFRP